MSEDRAGWVTELDRRDALLVHAFRCAAAALTESKRAVWADVERALEPLVADDRCDDTMRAFARFMRTVGSEARTAVRFHVPRCSCLGYDEAAFLALCHEVEAGRTEQAREAARTLIRERAVARLLRRCAAFMGRIERLSAADAHAGRARPSHDGPPHSARLH